MAVQKKRKRAFNSKWDDSFIITAYEMARDGLTESSMAKVLGISKPTFLNWERDNPLFKLAIKRGRAYLKRGVKPYADMMDYIYHQLPDDQKELWQKIHQLNLAGAGVEKVEALFADRGKPMRQKMFICALVKSNFNTSAACRMTGLNRNTIEQWYKDPDFQGLVRNVEEIEKDWGDSCLRRLMEAGDTSATIFFERCRNKEKYDDKSNQLNVNVQGQIQHVHSLVLMEDIGLPLNIQKLILSKVRERKQIESKVVEQGDAA